MDVWREIEFSSPSIKDKVLTIDDERANVITDPLRWRILQILDRGKSVTEISQALGVTDARVLYHIRCLVKTGIVRLEEGDILPQDWRCVPLAGKLRVRDGRPSPDASSEAMPDHVVDDFNQAFREVAEGLFGGASQISLNHNRSRLSEEQAAEFSRRLLALIEDFFPPGKGDQAGIKYGFYGVLTPIDLHPLSDSETDR